MQNDNEQLNQFLISILRKDGAERTNEELMFLKDIIGQNKFFGQIFEEYKNNQEVIKGIIKSVRYRKFNAFKMIFQQGDKGDLAYIIIQGKVLVSIKGHVDMFESEEDKLDKNFEEDDDTKQKLIEKYSIDNSLNFLIKYMKSKDKSVKNRSEPIEGLVFSQFLNQNAIDEMEEDELQLWESMAQKTFTHMYEQQYGKIILHLQDNALFGEKALIENKPRAASVCTVQETDCMYLEKEDFDVLINQFKLFQQIKNNFLIQMFPIFNTLVTSGKVFERLCRFFVEDNTYHNQIIIREGQKFSNHNSKVYLIQEGEFRVFKSYKVQMMSDKKLFHYVTQTMSLGTLVKGEFFGEESLKQDEGCYIYSIQCQTFQGKIMSLEKQAVLKKLPEQIKELILKKYQQKEEYRQALFQDLTQKKIKEDQEEQKETKLRFRHKNALKSQQNSGDQEELLMMASSSQLLPPNNPIQQQQQQQGNKGQVMLSQIDSLNQNSSFQNATLSSNINETFLYNINHLVVENQALNNGNMQNSTLDQVKENANYKIEAKQIQLHQPVNPNLNEEQLQLKLLQQQNQEELLEEQQEENQEQQEKQQPKSEDSSVDLEESGLTAIMMSTKEKVILRQKFSKYIYPGLNQKNQVLGQRLVDLKRKDQDPFPFMSKEAVVIRALKEEYKQRQNKINGEFNRQQSPGGLTFEHNQNYYKQIIKNFNQQKNSASYSEFMKNDKKGNFPFYMMNSVYSQNQKSNYQQSSQQQQQQNNFNTMNNQEWQSDHDGVQQQQQQQNQQQQNDIQLNKLYMRLCQNRMQTYNEKQNMPKITQMSYTYHLNNKENQFQHQNQFYNTQFPNQNIMTNNNNQSQQQSYQEEIYDSIVQGGNSLPQLKNKQFLGSFYRSLSPAMHSAGEQDGNMNEKRIQSLNSRQPKQIDFRVEANMFPDFQNPQQKNKQFSGDKPKTQPFFARKQGQIQNLKKIKCEGFKGKDLTPKKQSNQGPIYLESLTKNSQSQIRESKKEIVFSMKSKDSLVKRKKDNQDSQFSNQELDNVMNRSSRSQNSKLEKNEGNLSAKGQKIYKGSQRSQQNGRNNRHQQQQLQLGLGEDLILNTSNK